MWNLDKMEVNLAYKETKPPMATSYARPPLSLRCALLLPGAALHWHEEMGGGMDRGRNRPL